MNRFTHTCGLDYNMDTFVHAKYFQVLLASLCRALFAGLTHLPLNKMAANLAHMFKRIFLNENGGISIQITLQSAPSPIDNNPALVKVMAWRRTGERPLPEPMTYFTDAYMRHWGRWVNKPPHCGIVSCVECCESRLHRLKIDMKQWYELKMICIILFVLNLWRNH